MSYSCNKSYSKRGECLRKHEEKCSYGLSSALVGCPGLAKQPSAPNQPKSRHPCLFCGRLFVDPINHKCKVRACVPGAVFDFSDSLFETSNHQSENDESSTSFLNTAFSSTTESTLIKDVVEFTSNNARSFKTGLLNINSLHSKMHEISFLLDKGLLDVLVLNETKLDSTIDSASYENSRYDLFRRDRTRHGGGIIVYVKKGLKIKSISVDKDAEIISLNLNVSNETDIGVIACYRPESINSELFYDKLEQHTLELVNRSTNILVIGDLNTNMFESQTSPLSEFMSSYGFENTIRSGTRFNALEGLDTSRCHSNPLH